MKKHIIIIGSFIVIIVLLAGFQHWRMEKKEKADKQEDVSGYVEQSVNEENMSLQNEGESSLNEQINEEDIFNTYLDNDETEASERNENIEANNEGDRNQQHSGDIVIETEYDVKEYCKNCFIVSKNDDLLYGLLDISGNEILQVKYDDLSFLNLNQVREGKNENVYIDAEYEGQHQIFDSLGNRIFDEDVSVINYSYGKGDEDSAFWFANDKVNKIAKIYKEDRTLIQEIDYSQYSDLAMKWCCPDYYFATILNNKIKGNSIKVKTIATYLYNKSGILTEQWDAAQLLDHLGYENNVYYFWLLFEDASYGKYLLDSNGKTELLEKMTQQEATQEIASAFISQPEAQDVEREWKLGKNKELRLYYSNETFKLENEYGEPLYDERYYECYHENGCYILMNEDNQACVINGNGSRVIDYGWLEVRGNQMYFLGKQLDTDHFLNGGDVICIVTGENGLNSVYMFSE